MKNLFLIFLVALIMSCKKVIIIEPVSIENRIGNYQCIEITSSVVIDSIGNFTTHIDTTNKNIIINVRLSQNSNYTVDINSYTFYTSSNLDNKYFVQCYSGPCDYIIFNPNAKIVVFRKISNTISKNYSGKKI
jgi:hypothetical protein